MLDRYSALQAVAMHYSVPLLFEMIFWRLGCLVVKIFKRSLSSWSMFLCELIPVLESAQKDQRTEISFRYFFGTSERPTNAVVGMTFLVEDPSVPQKMPHEPILVINHSQIVSLHCLQCSQEN